MRSSSAESKGRTTSTKLTGSARLLARPPYCRRPPPSPIQHARARPLFHSLPRSRTHLLTPACTHVRPRTQSLANGCVAWHPRIACLPSAAAPAVLPAVAPHGWSTLCSDVACYAAHGVRTGSAQRVGRRRAAAHPAHSRHTQQRRQGAQERRRAERSGSAVIAPLRLCCHCAASALLSLRRFGTAVIAPPADPILNTRP